MSKKQDALVPVFGALCFFLSAIEFVIPKPLPFLRIGLANVPLMLALDVLSFPAFLLLTVIKILGQAFISGTLFSYLILFSAAGTIGAALTMYTLHKIPRTVLSLVGISIVGAFVSNCIQLFIGRFFIFGEGIRYIAPPFLVIGTITSLLLGIFCESFEAESEWYAHIRDTDSPLYVQLPDNTPPVAHPYSFYPGFTGKSGYLLRRFDTLSRRKAKNTLGSSLYFNGRNSSVSYLYSSRKRAFLNRKFPAHKRGATQRFGKSRCSASDDLYFSMDAASAYQNSGLNGYSA